MGKYAYGMPVVAVEAICCSGRNRSNKSFHCLKNNQLVWWVVLEVVGEMKLTSGLGHNECREVVEKSK